MTEAKDQIALLISLFVEEQIRLQKMIEEYVADHDYLMAHYHSRALKRVNARLQTFRNLDDKFYERKQFFQNAIENWKKLLTPESPGYVNEMYAEELRLAEAKLERINKSSEAKTTSTEEPVFDEALNALIEKRITNLRLVLIKSENFLIRFKHSKKAITLSIPNIRQLSKDGILDHHNLTSLTKLGFVMNESATVLVLVVNDKTESAIDQVRVVISKIVFEVFYFKTFDKQSYIEYKQRTNLRK